MHFNPENIVAEANFHIGKDDCVTEISAQV